MHIQGLRVLGSLSVLGLAATFFISALWVLIEVLFRSICWPGHPVSRALPALSPSPITLNAPVMGLKDGLTAALPAFRRMSWCSCLFPLLPSVLHSFEEEDHINLSNHLFTEGLLRALPALGPAPIPCAVSCGQHDGMFNRNMVTCRSS